MNLRQDKEMDDSVSLMLFIFFILFISFLSFFFLSPDLKWGGVLEGRQRGLPILNAVL